MEGVLGVLLVGGHHFLLLVDWKLEKNVLLTFICYGFLRMHIETPLKNGSSKAKGLVLQRE